MDEYHRDEKTVKRMKFKNASWKTIMTEHKSREENIAKPWVVNVEEQLKLRNIGTDKFITTGW